MKAQYQHTFPDAITYPKKSFPFTLKIVLFFCVNGIMALVMNRVPGLSTLHVYLTMAVGGVILLTSNEPMHLIYWMGYVVGAELVWRGLGANTFWETGKYAVIAFTILWMLKFKGDNRPNLALILYFVLLLPSIAMLRTFDRQAISFALSGPFVITITSILFSQLSINRSQLKNLMLCTMSSVIIFGVLALVGVISAESINFSGASIHATSANTGPNQGSSILGLGAFAAFLYAVLEDEHKFLRFLVIVIGLGLTTQVLLTFSRGGLWNLAGGVIVAGFFFTRDKRARNTFMLISISVVLAMNFFVMPALNRFTSGMLSERILDTSMTGRMEIIQSDIEVFFENPVFGVGPGRSNIYHARYFRVANAHTEYSRMLSEHGLFGAVSLLILLMTLAKKVFQKTASINRGVIASCIMWGMLFMAHSATRLAAPMFLLGLAFANFDLESGKSVKE